MSFRDLWVEFWRGSREIYSSTDAGFNQLMGNVQFQNTLFYVENYIKIFNQ